MFMKLAILGLGLAEPLAWRLAAEAADISLDERQTLLNGELREQFGMDEQGYQRFYLYETFDEYLIARGPEDKLFRIPYTVSGDEITFGDAQEVTTAYVSVAESCAFVASEADAQADSGRYPIVALRAGWGNGALNGEAVPHYYPATFVARVAEALDGKPFGRRHPDQKSSDPTGATQPDRVAGWLSGGGLVGTDARATVNLFSAEADLRSRLDEARSNKKLDLFAVSMLAMIGYKPGVVEGKQCMVAESLGELYSVDLCQRAGAGGRFLTAASFAGNSLRDAQLRAVNPQSTAIAPIRPRASHSGANAAGGASMKSKLLQLLKLLNAKNAARGAELSLEFANVAEAEYDGFFDKVTAALAEGAPAAAVTAEAVASILADAQRVQSRNRIETKLTDSKLAEPAKKLARTHLEAKLTAEANVTDATIDAEIAGVREAFAAFDNVGTVRGRTIVGLETADKMALAMEAAMGVKESIGKGVPAFRGLREAYTTTTGDFDLSKLSSGGGFTVSRLASEAVATGDFPNLLLNSMTKRLLQDYAELALDGLDMLYLPQTISDFKVQDRVREGYFGEFSTVAEAGTYTEIAKPTDERVSYSVAKKGNLLTISEETIRNDDLGAIARFPGRLARAGRFTLKTFITNFFVNNPNFGADTVAWFHATHSNLGTAALSQDALIAARVLLRRQTEKDSTEPLGLSLDWIMVPPELESTAGQINQTDTAGSNAFFHAFGANNERIIVNEKLADTNDWYYGSNQANAPFLEIGFLDGIRQPQIFLANQPTVGTQFTADQLQYKVKFVFGGAIIDFRGVGKNVVP
jgi:hypothetical protein